MRKTRKESKRKLPTKFELASAIKLKKQRYSDDKASPRVPLPKGIHPESFGLKISGDCLAPLAISGQVLLVEPIRPEPGDIAVIWIKGQSMPAAKILKTKLYGFPIHPESEVIPIFEFEQLNPPKRFAVAGDKIEECFRVERVLDGDSVNF